MFEFLTVCVNRSLLSNMKEIVHIIMCQLYCAEFYRKLLTCAFLKKRYTLFFLLKRLLFLLKLNTVYSFPTRVVLDGVDLDIEGGSRAYWVDFVKELRRLMSSDSKKKIRHFRCSPMSLS